MLLKKFELLRYPIFLVIVFVFLSALAPAGASAAEIEVIMPQRTGVNQTFPIKFNLNTLGKQTIGTDLLIELDYSELEFIQAEPAEFYPNNHQPKIYLDKNQLRYSGTSNYLDYQAGSGELVTLFFKKKIVGQPKFELIWEEGATSDTNVIGIDGKDLMQHPPTIKYDNSFREKPSAEGALSGDILGHQLLSNNPLAINLPQSEKKLATPIKNASSSFKKIIFFIAFIIALLFLLLIILVKRKRKEQET